MDINARFNEILSRHRRKAKANRTLAVAATPSVAPKKSSGKLKMILKYSIISICVVTVVIIVCVCLRRISETGKPAVEEPVDWKSILKKEEETGDDGGKKKSKKKKKRVTFKEIEEDAESSSQDDDEYDNESSFSEEDMIDDFTRLDDL